MGRPWGSQLGGAGVAVRRLNDAALAPDGRTVASTGDDGIVHVFACVVCGGSADVLALARSRDR